MELRAGKNKIDKDVFEELCGAIGRECVIDSIEERESYSFDDANVKSIPDLVITPHSTEQVSSVLSIANKHNIAICTCSVGDVLSGGAAPIRGGIVLDLKNMNRIDELNARDLTITVEPGVVTKDLQDEVVKSRLFYPPESESGSLSTIGERVAECTGGMTGMKYGVTRDYVLALEIVLPDGSVINAGRKTLKSVAGYDLTRFFVGSEWTLGVFTKITLKLLPMPERTGTVMSCFKDIESALNATDTILSKNHLNPRALEFTDKTCIDAVRETDNGKIPEEAEALLLIDVDGNEKNVTNDLGRIDAICRENSALKTLITHTDEERGRLWDIRKSIYPPLSKVASMKFNEDLTVPRSKVRAVLKKIYELSNTYSLEMSAFGKIGEGHIHLSVNGNSSDADEVSAHDLVSQILKDVEPNGGTNISELAPHETEIMKDLKRMFDPKGIMNPGRLFGESFAQRRDAEDKKEN